MSITDGTVKSSYTLPNDAPEANRLDTQHELFRLSFNGRLIFAPIGPQPAAILDIGCGTSTWAIEVANLYPNSNVYGLDLGQPQPSTFPSNYTYMVGNFEKSWPFEDAQLDYVYGRFLNVAISEHKFVIAEALRCLKPGGWFEIQEFALHGLASVKSVTTYWKLYVESAAKMGRNLGAPLLWSSWLKEAGFEEVQQEIFEWPIGPQKGEVDERKVTIGNMVMINYMVGIRGISVGFLTEGAGWTEEKVDEYLADVKKDMKEDPDENVLPILVVWGQKPK